jgi:hypothetical protein
VRNGKVLVTLTRLEERHLVMTVADDGVGLPSDFNVRQARGLGMRIVRALAEQLGADLQVRSRHPGAEFALDLPIESGA